MFQWIFSLLIVGWFGLAQQTATVPRIDTLLPGQAVQGLVSLSGSTAMDGFATAQVEFRYEDDPSQTWFLIQDQVPAIENNVLASWDTTTISDGVYHLRLKVIRTDGSEATFEIAGVRVRNYSVIETNTPAAEDNATQVTSPSATPTAALLSPTPTPQPPNPVSVTNADLQSGVTYGLMVTLSVFILFVIYLGVRRLGRR